MEKEQLKEFLQILWCAMNCATDNDSQMKIMGIIEKYGGNSSPKWLSYIDKKQDIFKTSLKEMEELLK